MTRIENWWQRTQVPTIGRGIHGQAYDSERWSDGQKMQTSKVVKAEGRVVTTESGSTYLLGRPMWPDIVKDQDNPFGTIYVV